MGSVSRWIHGAKVGCESSATALWQRYGGKLLRVARGRLNGTSRAVADEEDVALAAFQSFLRRTKAGSYSGLNGRDELWRLLATITARKAIKQVRDLQRQKRGGSWGGAANEKHIWSVHSPASLVSPLPSAEYTALLSDSLEQLLTQLADGELQQIVLLRLEGYTNPEIAAEINRSVPTVERRLRLIRETWKLKLDNE